MIKKIIKLILINQGKQLNDSFHFIKQTESVIKDLVNLKKQENISPLFLRLGLDKKALLIKILAK